MESRELFTAVGGYLFLANSLYFETSPHLEIHQAGVRDRGLEQPCFI
jgi:hypothetical protein